VRAVVREVGAWSAVGRAEAVLVVDLMVEVMVKVATEVAAEVSLSASLVDIMEVAAVVAVLAAAEV
jgi:hypothetical protein